MNSALEALLFPKERQKRGQDPGPFADYRSYKPYLQKLFRNKCVYCRVADGIKGSEGFGVDHYLPRSKYPHLGVTWSNLFYACNVCNTWKGESVSQAAISVTLDELNQIDRQIERLTGEPISRR